VGVTIRAEDAQSRSEETVTPAAAAGVRVALIGSLTLASLAVGHFVFHWVLLTDALLRWILY
jgi:hypothetical protein